jgi:hypothetical protein
MITYWMLVAWEDSLSEEEVVAVYRYEKTKNHLGKVAGFKTNAEAVSWLAQKGKSCKCIGESFVPEEVIIMAKEILSKERNDNGLYISPVGLKRCHSKK